MSTEALLRGVQSMVLRLKRLSKKDLQKVDNKRALAELGAIQSEAIGRLRKLDRNSPEFFPENILIEYANPPPPEAVLSFEHREEYLPQNGQVICRMEKTVIVQLENEKYPIETHPSKLKIRFLRENFI